MNMHSRLKYAAILVLVTVTIGGGALARQGVQNPEAAKLANPVGSTPESLGVGKRAYDTNCAACHGNMAQGAARAGIAISIIAEQGGKQPPDLTDSQWDHGSTDGEIFTAIKKGVPPSMMAGWEGRLSDTEIWSVVNYLRAVAANKSVTVAAAPASDTKPKPILQLTDYVQMPITADNTDNSTRAELARVNFLRDEPGGRRFFVNDLNGPLYILDKQTKQFTKYLDFNGLEGRPGLFQEVHLPAQLRDGPHQRRLRS